MSASGSRWACNGQARVGVAAATAPAGVFEVLQIQSAFQCKASASVWANGITFCFAPASHRAARYAGRQRISIWKAVNVTPARS